MILTVNMIDKNFLEVGLDIEIGFFFVMLNQPNAKIFTSDHGSEVRFKCIDSGD